MYNIEHSLINDVQSQLLQLSYPAWAELVSRLLSCMDYEMVEPLGRSKTGNRFDGLGCDLMAVSPVTGGRRIVAVLAKQYGRKQSIMRRQVDELRGVCGRLGADEGLIVSSGKSSTAVRTYAHISNHRIPVRIIDLPRLCRLLCAYHLGIWEQTPSKASDVPKRGLDAEFFEALDAHVTE